MKKAMWVIAWCMAAILVVGCSDTNTDKPEVLPKLTAEQALEELIRKAKSGDAQAQHEYGWRFFSGNGVPKDAAQAVTWWRKAAEQGFAGAQTDLGLMYASGKEVPVDTAQAVKWYRKAAEQGEAVAQRMLGLMYFNGEGLPKDTAQAVKWYRKAADQGDADAQNNLGWLYSNGMGVPKDAVQAVTWWRKAAELGQADAQNYLGWAYKNGMGLPKDANQAVTWWRKAAEQGNSTGQNALGEAYDYGFGVPKDATQAVEWYRKAAKQGHSNAQNSLGAAYGKGEGVPRDYTYAYMWFNLAAAQGNEQSARNREIAAGRMTSGQLAEAQRLTREWKPGKHTASTTETVTTPSGMPEKAATGTAFVVSDQGHLLTNHHVVMSCQQVRLAGSDKPLKVLTKDEANDLALLQMADKPQSVAVFRSTNDLRQGESIVIYGYPLEGALAAGGNLAPGVVSALAGLGNNTSQIQITAPVQPGNSGGPVLDSKGQVVGVVVQKLDAVKVAKLTGDVPQNVNFAINAATTRTFLESNQVPYKTGNWWNLMGKNLEDTAAEARKYTVVVECWK
jgi:TPR repeat protein